MSGRNTIDGSCHCGNIAFILHTDVALEDIELRRCACTFCARHNPRHWSDPDGGMDIQVEDAPAIGKYRFGHGTADFVFCKRCGVYAFAISEESGCHRAVINMNLATEHEFRLGEGLLHPDGEERADRDARRARNWTPIMDGWPLNEETS